MNGMRLRSLALLGLTACAPAASGDRTGLPEAQAARPRVIAVPAGTGGIAAVLARATGPVRIELAPGEHVLEAVAWTDPSCGNCQDATESVPATLGLRVSGRGIEIAGPGTGEAVIRTGAGYGVLFEDCESCAIRNVAITGGVRDADGRATNAAVVVRRSTVAIEDCIIRDNIGDSATVAATIVGIAGIAGREGADMTVRGCRIIRNSWDGIALYRGARATITDNVVDGVDKASGARVGGGRGVGIGMTWDARASVERNLVRRYWKGIGAFVAADADIRENIVEDILTWGIALWGPDGSLPSARIERNVIYRTGACGVILDRPDGSPAAGSLVDNLIMRTGQNERYDSGEPYCWQRPIARLSVPSSFREAGNLLAQNRQPQEAGSAPPPLPELRADAAIARAHTLTASLARHPALREALLFSELPETARP